MTEKVDVLYINPGDRKQIYQNLGDEFSAVEPPVFAGLYATYARLKGRSCAIYDANGLNVSAQQAAREVMEQYDARLIVMVVYGHQPSASTQNMSAAGKICGFIKAIDSTQALLMLGTHPSALPLRTMQEESVDFVIDIEGPIGIEKLLRNFDADKGDIDLSDFGGIPSLWWRRGKEIVAPLEKEKLIANLDVEMPGVAWDLIDMTLYRAHNWHCFEGINERSPYASIHTSLGCPYACSFCCINAPFGKSSYRFWSPEAVVKEIDYLVETYGVKHIKFVDEMFVLNKRHVLGICELLAQRPYKVNIWAYARVDTVSDDVLAPLKAAGVNWICLGIESASDHVRDGAKKIYANNDIIEVVRRIQRAGIHVIGNYIFGLPDDTLARMQDTLDLALQLNCEFANFYSAMPYPGSQLYRQAEVAGQKLPKQWADYSQHGFDTLPLANDYCSAAEILGFRDKAFIEYYQDESYLELIRNKFGEEVVAHLQRMVEVPMQRGILQDKKIA